MIWKEKCIWIFADSDQIHGHTMFENNFDTLLDLIERRKFIRVGRFLEPKSKWDLVGETQNDFDTHPIDFDKKFFGIGVI